MMHGIVRCGDFLCLCNKSAIFVDVCKSNSLKFEIFTIRIINF